MDVEIALALFFLGYLTIYLNDWFCNNVKNTGIYL